MTAFLAISCGDAHAWDDDFHQHLTTLISRDLGYGERIADVAGALSAYTDVSLASGPFLFYNARVYMHFNGFYPAKILEKQSSMPLLEAVLSYIRSSLMVSDARSPVPHAFFTHAMKERDLIGMFGHLHSIQDLEPHTGFYSLDGHRAEGHGPDRYWMTPETISKFKNSVRQSYVALWAARHMLPQEDLDFDHSLFLIEDLRRREDPNFKGFSAEEKKKLLDQPLILAEAAINHPDLMAIYSYSFLKDPEYVASGLVWFIQNMQRHKIIAPGLNFADAIPGDLKLDGTLDLPQVIARILASGHFMKDNLGNELFDMNRLMSVVFPEFKRQSFDDVLKNQVKLELATLMSADQRQGDLFVGSHLGPQADAFGQLHSEALERAKMAIAKRVTMFLAKGFITMPIDKNNHVDSFEEPELRHKELEIRQRKWNDLLQKFIGKRVAFDARVLRNRGFIGKTLRKLPFFHPDLFAHRHVHEEGPESLEHVLTIPQRWRLHWVIRMIRKVLFVSPRTVFSEEFLAGATDYQQIDKLKGMVEDGTLKPFTKEEIDKLMSSFHSPFEKLVDRFVRAIGKGESSPIAADGGLLQELKIYSDADTRTKDCGATLMGGADDHLISEELKKL